MNNKINIITVTLNPAIDFTVAVENFRADAVHRVKWSEKHPGGKGINVAAFLSDTGIKVKATGFLGAKNEEIFHNFFLKKKIGDYFIRLNGETRLGIKIVDPTKDDCTTDVNFPGLTPGKRDLTRLLKWIQKFTKPGAFLILSGSIPPETDPTLYKILCQSARNAGAKVIVDTSGKPLSFAVAAKPSVIKPNIEECSDLAGKKLTSVQDVVSFSKELIASGLETVIVSMGSKGSVFCRADEVWIAEAPKVKTVSTVGAGDALLSGYVYSQVKEFPLFKGAQIATAFAIARITKLSENLPPITEIEKIMESIKVSRLV